MKTEENSNHSRHRSKQTKHDKPHVPRTFTTMVVGDRGVGKRNLIQQVVDACSPVTETSPSGADSVVAITTRKYPVQLEIYIRDEWNPIHTESSTLGSEVQGIALVYCVTDVQSFQTLSLWVQRIEEITMGDRCVVILGYEEANGTSPRVISPEQGKEFASHWGVPYYDLASPLEADDLVNVFYQFSEQIRRCQRHSRLQGTSVPIPKVLHSYQSLPQPYLRRLLCCDEVKVLESLARHGDRDVLNLTCVPPHSPWCWWIPFCYWFREKPPPSDCCHWIDQWTDIHPQQLIYMMKGVQSMLDPRVHGNLLHLAAFFGIGEDILSPLDLPLRLIEARNQQRETPCQIIARALEGCAYAVGQCQDDEERARMQARYERFQQCEQYFLQVEVSWLVEQKGVQQKIQVEYTKEDDALLDMLRGIVHTRKTPSIVGNLLQLQYELATGATVALDVTVKCSKWIDQLIALHWSGVAIQDEEELETIQQALKPARRWKLTKRHAKNSLRMPRIIKHLCSRLMKHLPSARELFERQCNIAFANVMAWCQCPPKEPVEGTWLHDVELGSLLLQDEAAHKLMPSGELQKEIAAGHHVVISHCGMHFKCLCDNRAVHANLMPALPGVEFMVDRLAKLIVGHGTAPARLIKLTRGDRHIQMQVAKSVEGIGLEKVLATHPEWIPKFDRRNIADMVLVGLVTNPQDGKADNYMVEVEYQWVDATQERQVTSLHLIGIDNDMAFGDAIDQHQYGGTTDFVTEVRNVVYLLPSMDESIPPASRERFLSSCPELTILEWLRMIGKRNEQYQALQEEGIFSQVEFEGDPRDSNDEGLQLPIRIPEFVLTRLYRDLVKIREYLEGESDATLHELFAYVEPALAEWYRQTRELDLSIEEQINLIYTKSLREQLGDGVEDLVVSSQGNQYRLFSQMIYRASRRKTRKQRKLTVAEAVGMVLGMIPVTCIGRLLHGGLLRDLPLPDPTELMHMLLSRKRLTCSFLHFLLERGADVKRVSEIRGCYPIHLALHYPTPWVVDLVRDLVDAGSPIDEKSESGDVGEIMAWYIKDSHVRIELAHVLGITLPPST